MLDMNKLNAMLDDLADKLTEPWRNVGWADTRHETKVKNAHARILQYVAEHKPKGDSEPFDLERAKAGAEFEIRRAEGTWHQVKKFIGVTSDYRIVAEEPDGVCSALPADGYRMKPRKMRTVYLNVRKASDGPMVAWNSEDAAIHNAGLDEALTHIAYPVQVPE